MISVTFWSLFLMLLSLFSSLFCQTPFAGLLLRQGDKWGFKGCLASLPGNRPFPAFFVLFLPFSPLFGGLEEHLGNPENGGKRPFSSDVLAAQNLEIRSAPQKSLGLWLRKDVIAGMHIVSLIDRKILNTRTITRLVRENQLNVEDFKKFKAATHESSVHCQEDPMIRFRCCSKISFKHSCFSRRTMSSLSQQNQTIVHPDCAASSAEGATSASARPSDSSDVQIQPPPGLPQPQPTRRRITVALESQRFYIAASHKPGLVVKGPGPVLFPEIPLNIP